MNKAPAAAATIDDYIAAFPRAVRTRLEALRRAIRAAAPEAVEAISYRIPAFKQDGRALVYFAGYETHIGLYPVHASDMGLAAAELQPYTSGKATLRFPLDQPLPLDLVARVVRAKLGRATRPPARTRPPGSKVGPLDVTFTATLVRNESPSGWTYVVWPKSAEFFGTNGLVKVEAMVDGVPMTTSFMATGDGRHMLPIKAEVRRSIGKKAGDRVKVELRTRLR
jgi:uncharacterized protein YdhG (YjbR/CyaY superfamily)